MAYVIKYSKKISKKIILFAISKEFRKIVRSQFAKTAQINIVPATIKVTQTTFVKSSQQKSKMRRFKFIRNN